ncbi:RNA polymerase sigma factor SigJ [Actinomadura luteofluorescens]|uniref:RNA polymerase sigma-70 factor (ECF subfamily) n=1 Tax=Actinomadura luteofluorescens TaxID=46163 RepID=A0A7Y9JFA4_9ACTN|nr:RNA polymerase sigma factor SigJ [Actinomadura luteofluorescens]NYD46957.1 RNA polymerase sigma-70 factor (ECF subfamily) [Actinomadura luteofluorescens]
MDDLDWETNRPAVFGAAYRLLGSVAEAEDVVQDVWLRACGADRSGVRDPRAWLVTIAARLAYNVLKSARVRREEYPGPWLPEPLLTGPDVADRVIVDDSVSTAMLLVMEELTPAERVAFVLHDVFDVPFAQVAGVLGGSAAAARKLASRARGRVADAREARPKASRAERERVLTAFRAAAEGGDIDRLVRLLHPDAVYVADGGGRAVASRRPITGADRIARLLVGVAARSRTDRVALVEVGGELALETRRDGRVVRVDTLEIADGRVTAFHRIANPDKLRHL